MRGALIVLAIAIVLVTAPAAPAATPAGCQKASGNAGNKCLAKYLKTVERCRKTQDAPCEDAARAEDGSLDDVVAAVDKPIRRKCDDETSEVVAFRDTDDLVSKTNDACVDWAEDFLGLGSAPASTAGAFVKCQRTVTKELGKLRAGTIKLFGPGCAVKEFKGKRCNRTKRDKRAIRLRLNAQGKIEKKCAADGGGYDSLGLGPLDVLIDRVQTRARHFAIRVYPPHSLGPTAERGPFEVGVRTLELEDSSRMNLDVDLVEPEPRPVVTEVWYPTTAEAVAGKPREVATVLGLPVTETPTYRDVERAPGVFPLVVFSHGNQGIRIQSLAIMALLVSHGYVVASPDHHGNTFVDSAAGIVDQTSATNRPLDMSFVIDELLRLNTESGSFLKDAIDPNAIGATGHSFGGLTSWFLAGGGPPSIPADPRVKAILPQAPASPEDAAFYQGVTVPTLIVGGSLDATTPFAAQQQFPFDSMPSGAAIVALAELEGGGHFTFSDFCEVDRILLAFLGGFEEACEPRHLPWRHARGVIVLAAAGLRLAFVGYPLADDVERAITAARS